MSKKLLILTCLAAALACGDRIGSSQLAEATARLRDLYALRDWEHGVQEGDAWARRAPKALELQAWYVLHLARSGETDSAVAVAERLVQRDSSSVWAWFALAGALNRHDQRGLEALEASKRLLSTAPANTDLLWMRAEVLRRQRSESAIPFIDSLPPEIREDPHLLVSKAVTLYEAAGTAGEVEKGVALATFARARAQDSTDVDAHYLPGAFLLSERRDQEAWPLLQRSILLTPAVLVHETYWQALLHQQDLSQAEKRRSIEADIQGLIATRGETPVLLQRSASIYAALGDSLRQRQLEERLLQLHPDSREAEFLRIVQIRSVARELSMGATGAPKAPKREALRRELEEFIGRPRHHNRLLLGEAYSHLFWLVKEDSTVSNEEFYPIVDGLIRYERLNVHTTYPEAAIALAERKTHLPEAEQIARQGLVEARKKVDEYREQRVYASDEEYEKTLQFLSSLMRDALGWVYFTEGRLDEAETELLAARDSELKSARTQNYHARNLYHLGRLYEVRANAAATMGRDAATPASHWIDRAEESYAEGAAIAFRGTNPNDEALRSLYAKRHGGLQGFEAYRNNLQEHDRDRRRRIVLAERRASPEAIRPFRFAGLEGSELASPSLAGKIAVIHFWGMWCGPCVSELPEFQKFHEKWRAAKDVVILTVNNDLMMNPSKTPDHVRQWMRENGYDFPVFLDNGYVMTAGIQAFPTTWFVDPKGRIAFSKMGATRTLQEEFSWRVEALRGD